MIRRKQFAWFLAACAALIGQSTPKASCGTCDRPCCTDRADGLVPVAAEPRAMAADRCPLCEAAAEFPKADANDRPCRCRLDARNDQPLPQPRTTRPFSADALAAFAPAADAPAVPDVLGVSREYLAASLAAPIRPPRILFGVWRN